MANVDSSEVQLAFECDECNNKELCNVAEAVYNGPPICLECEANEIMSMSHCCIEV